MQRWACVMRCASMRLVTQPLRAGRLGALRAAMSSASSSDSSSSTPRLRVYTRTGDAGTSSLFTGERRSKDDAVFEALGASDELNSHIGMAMAHCSSDGLDEIYAQLLHVQCMLQDLGANLATPRDSAAKARIERTQFPESYTQELEDWIDAHDESLPALTHFVLPSGNAASAALHVARSVCRRVERRVVQLAHVGAVDDAAQKFINRLSDYLFTVARRACLSNDGDEIIYLSATQRREAQLRHSKKQETGAA